MESNQRTGETGTGVKAFTPQPVSAAEAFVAGGRARLRTLMVCAAPLGTGMPLNLRREWALLRRHAEESRAPMTLYRLQPPTPEALIRALLQCAEHGVTPHIVHFAGHGQPRYLCFEDELGREAQLQREDLAAVLGQHRVPVAILNACHSATWQTVSLARYLVEKGAVEVAVGHSEPVADTAAMIFAGELYRRLCSGEEAMLAFVQARGLLSQSHPGATAAIELHGNDGLRLMTHGEPGISGACIYDGTSGRGRMPEVPAFFGREEELLKLAGLLTGESMRGAALVGIGGIGKTALALELANRHSWRYPGGMAFVSAHSILFGEPSADELVRNATATLMIPAGGYASPMERLLSHLQQQPGLLVFDNLEDLPEPELERLLRVIEQLPLNGSKVVLTSRSSPSILHEWPWLQVVTLARGLSDGAGAAYVVRQGREKQIEALAEAARDPNGLYQGLPLHLTRALGGHPKMLDVAVGIASRGLPALHQAIPELDANGSEEMAAETLANAVMEKRMGELLTSSVNLVDEDGRWLLALLPFFPDGSFTPDELLSAALAAYDEGEREASDEVRGDFKKRLKLGVQSCRRAGLIDLEAEDLLRCHPTVQEHARQHLPLEKEVQLHLAFGLTAAAISYIDDHRRDYPALERRLSHLLAVLENAWAFDFEPLQKLVAGAADVLGSFFLARGYWPIMARWQERLAILGDEGTRARGHRLLRESRLLHNQGKADQARSVLAESRQIFEELGDERGHASCLHQLAIIEESQGRYDRARDLLHKSIQIKQETDDIKGRAASLHQLAIIEAGQGRYDEAARLLREAIQVFEETGSASERSSSLHQLAIVEECQGRYDEARELLRQALQINEEIGDTRGRGASLHQLAIIEESQGRHPEARALLREAIQVFDETGATGNRASSLHQLAIIEEKQGRYCEARDRLLEAIQTWEEIGDAQGRAASLHQLAAVEEAQGRYESARELLCEAMQVFTEIGDTNSRAISLQALATVDYRQGRYDEARDLLCEAIPRLAENGDVQGRAACLHRLAMIEHRQGRDSEARDLLHEAVQVFKELGDLHGQATSLHQLAMVETGQGRDCEAHDLLCESMQLFEEIGDTKGCASTLQQLGMIAEKRGREDEAYDLYLRSRDISEEIGDHDGCAASLHQLGMIEQRRGRDSDALVLFRESAQINERTGNRLGRATSLIMIGQLEAKAGELETGIAMVREAVEILRQLGSGDLARAEEILARLSSTGSGGNDHDP